MITDVGQNFLQTVAEELEHQRLILPTLPEVALQVRDAVNDPEIASTDLARLVATDAAMSARLVRIANSPLYRGSFPVDSLEAAITRLGHRIVRDLVLSISMEQIFQATAELTDQRLREAWEHSRQVAAISHVLSARLDGVQPEQAMLAGLIHDIGILPLLTYAEESPELLQDEKEFNQLVQQLHPRVGATILQAWDFPEEFIRVAADHEDLKRDSPIPDLVDLVIVANLQSALGSDHFYSLLDWRLVPAFDKLRLNPNVTEVEIDAVVLDEVESVLWP